jgi:uroporphyrinogen decarboxylase
MNKIQRVQAALKGEDLDRPPFSFWYHFGLQHASPDRSAQAHIDFFNSYDLDFIKVMNDYSYPASDNFDFFSEEREWKSLRVLSGDESGFGKQLEVLSMMSNELKGEAYFVETIFSPWTTARRLSDAQSILALKQNNPELLLDVMQKIAESLANYASKAIDAGAAGIFLSLSASNRNIMSYSDYERFCRPFDLMVLNAVKEKSSFNILHIHGQQIFFEELLDYPVQAINWSHMHTPPSLAEARKLYNGCLLGGIDEAQFSHTTVKCIEQQIDQTIESIGRNHLMITPGCSVQTDSAPKLLHTVRKSLLKHQK